MKHLINLQFTFIMTMVSVIVFRYSRLLSYIVCLMKTEVSAGQQLHTLGCSIAFGKWWQCIVS